MNIRTLILPLAAVAGLAFATAEKAQAAPITHVAMGGFHFGGGVGVRFPIGRSHGPSGYWTTQTVPMNVQVQVPYTTTVQVPDHVIGTDVYGHPIWMYRTETRTEYRLEWRTQYVTQQVWVPTYAPRTSGWVGLGLRFR